MTQTNARRVMLVGSIALPTPDDVFRDTGKSLKDLLDFVPDGETGERRKWVGFFNERLLAVPQLEPAYEFSFGGEVPQTFHGFKLKEGVSAEDVDLGSPSYAAIAKESYAAFLKARDAGQIAAGTRFQVSLPSPLVLASFLVLPFDQRLQIVERVMLRELDEILASIPHDDLLVQWDLARETEGEEARRHPESAPPFLQPDYTFDQMIAASAPIVDAVPATVPVGIHLCYGSAEGGHLVEPADGTAMRDIMEALFRTVRRTIDFIHVPIPRQRDDDAFFAPFDGLAIPDETKIYLGLIHLEDGVEGARRRLATAERHIAGHAGLATECGLGRCRTADIPALLALHRDVAEQV